MAPFKSGTLDKHGVRISGANADAIDRGEDRQRFKDSMIPRVGERAKWLPF